MSTIADIIAAHGDDLPEGYRAVEVAYGAPNQHWEPLGAIIKAEGWVDTNGILRWSDRIAGMTDERGYVQDLLDQDGGDGSVHGPEVIAQSDDPEKFERLLAEASRRPSVIADYEQEAKERCTRALARARAKLTAETLTQADLDWLGVEDYESDEGTIGSPSIAINDAGNLVAWEPVPSSLDDEAPWDAVSEETEIPALVVARIRAWRTRDGGRITGAEFAAYRHLIGLTVDELASALRVNPRTARSWESGRDPIPARVAEELEALAVEHRALARRMADDGRPVAIRRDKTAPTDKPRGWYVAAAARALVIEPDLEVEWV